MGDYLSELHKIWIDIYEWLIKQAEAKKQRANKARRKSDVGPGEHVLLYKKHLKLKQSQGSFDHST